MGVTPQHLGAQFKAGNQSGTPCGLHPGCPHSGAWIRSLLLRYKLPTPFPPSPRPKHLFNSKRVPPFSHLIFTSTAIIASFSNIFFLI